MPDCVFCKLIAKNKLKTILADDLVVAFPDIEPKTPVHMLIVPKKHIDSIMAATEADEQLLGHLFTVAKQIASEKGLSEGFRLVLNTGPDAGQTVGHIHMHLLAGEPLGSMCAKE